MIPEWDGAGLIPPIPPGHAGHSSIRSPYRASMVEVVERFGQTVERAGILLGLLKLRAELRNAGLGDGVQWLDGSFLEDVERTQSRAPNDIDVVSWVPLGDTANQHRLVRDHPALFDRARVKHELSVDHFPMAFDPVVRTAHVDQVSYWYSMWAHRRVDLRWKGFVEVSLAEDDHAVHGELMSRVIPEPLDEGGR